MAIKSEQRTFSSRLSALLNADLEAQQKEAKLISSGRTIVLQYGRHSEEAKNVKQDLIRMSEYRKRIEVLVGRLHERRASRRG